MRRLFETLTKTMQIAGQIVLAFMVVTICYDAFMRYVFTAPTSWSLEINTFLIVFVAAMTAADVQRTDGHIRITFFSDMMGRFGQRILNIVIGLVGVGFCSIMAWRGFPARLPGLRLWRTRLVELRHADGVPLCPVAARLRHAGDPVRHQRNRCRVLAEPAGWRRRGEAAGNLIFRTPGKMTWPMPARDCGP